jgi:hypothetical protein
MCMEAGLLGGQQEWQGSPADPSCRGDNAETVKTQVSRQLISHIGLYSCSNSTSIARACSIIMASQTFATPFADGYRDNSPNRPQIRRKPLSSAFSNQNTLHNERDPDATEGAQQPNQPLMGQPKHHQLSSSVRGLRGQKRNATTLSEKTPGRRHKFNHVVSKYWLVGISAWILALLIFGGLVGVLKAFDGANVPKWRFGITLGAIASLFASVGGYILMIPLSSALGQWKWLWCRTTRPVSDFTVIERASRGPLGSLLLLFRWKGGYVFSPVLYTV